MAELPDPRQIAKFLCSKGVVELWVLGERKAKEPEALVILFLDAQGAPRHYARYALVSIEGVHVPCLRAYGTATQAVRGERRLIWSDLPPIVREVASGHIFAQLKNDAALEAHWRLLLNTEIAERAHKEAVRKDRIARDAARRERNRPSQQEKP